MREDVDETEMETCDIQLRSSFLGKGSDVNLEKTFSIC